MPDLNTLMNTPTTSCFNFVAGGRKFQFCLQDNRVYYNDDEESDYIREINPHYYRFTEKSPGLISI
ncbi:MAG: hypothetical protein JXJ04_24355 [Spirochaetales bacterium]|nr:hypothetical protein [Spirochaetales bacterium]